MSRTKKAAPTIVALGAAASLTLAACGDDRGVAVGSKEFSEQIILGQMMVIALEDAGYDVVDQTDLAGTAPLRRSLEEGEVDLYWEYTGTAWVDIFGEEEVIEDPDQLLETVAERDEANGIVWGERGDFENTYAIAQNQETAQEYQVTNLSELAELSETDPEAASICLAAEFAERPDGFPGMQRHYGMDVPDAQQSLMDEGVIYNQIAEAPNSDCNFGMVFTTDGRIGSLDLDVLDDDEAFFPEYNPAITVREELADEDPEVLDIANDIVGRLDFEAMGALNLEADDEGVPHDEVARNWLESEGIIGGD